MKLVFSSQNSQYEPLSKSYHFRLKETFNSGKKFTIHSISIKLENMTTFPNEVLLCSNSIASMMNKGHFRTFEDGLGHISNVIAYLNKQESGIFYLKNPLTLDLTNNSKIHEFDFYFTDGSGNILDMRETHSPLTTVSDNEILDSQNCLFFTDITHPNTLRDQQNVVVPTPLQGNEQVNYIQDRKSALLQLALAYGQNGLVAGLGNNTFAITRGLNQSWQSYFDSTAWLAGSNPLVQDGTFHFHYLWSMNNVSDFTMHFYNDWMRLAMYQSVFTVIDSANQYTNQSQNIQILAKILAANYSLGNKEQRFSLRLLYPRFAKDECFSSILSEKILSIQILTQRS